MKQIVLAAWMVLAAIASTAQPAAFDHQRGKHLSIDGADIYYEEIANAGKPTLLFLHGGAGDIENFNALLPMFADDYHIVGIDSLGHGKSTLGPNDLSYKRLQLDVEAVARHLQLKQIDIIGFSDGGVVAYRLAAAGNIPIRRIVTIGATWSLSDAELMEQIVADMTLQDWKRYFFDDYQRLNPQPDFERFVKCVTEMWIDKTQDGYPLASVERIAVPTLIIRGNDDFCLPLESAVELAAKIENSLLFNIPFAPHDAYRKYPHFFEAVTKEFLK